MRLFVALIPPAAVLDAVAEAVASARGRSDSLRWEPREQWHVTLLFLGETPEERVDAVRERLARTVERHRTMTLGLSGAGTFPENPEHAHVLWAGLTGDTVALTALADDLRAAAIDAGVAVERRGYTPHLTLARSRRRADLTAPHAALASLTTRLWVATEAHLMHSRSEGTPRYRSVADWGLT